jgi:transposase
VGCGLSKAHIRPEVRVSHGNARLTVHGRKLIVDRHAAGWKQAHIAAAMGISRKCVGIWITRYATEGEAGLEDRSSRPHTSPTRTPAEVEDRIIELRARERRGPDWLGAELGVPARTVSRVLARRGQPRLSALDPITGALIRSSKHTAIRYERSRPGELVHMDVKKLGRIPDGGGWRAHGRAAGSTARDRATRSGFDYVQAALPLAERQGRTAQPHPGHRVGLPAGVHQQRPARRRPCPLDRALQHSTPPQRTRRTTTDQPSGTNLMAGYT